MQYAKKQGDRCVVFEEFKEMITQNGCWGANRQKHDGRECALRTARSVLGIAVIHPVITKAISARNLEEEVFERARERATTKKEKISLVLSD